MSTEYQVNISMAEETVTKLSNGGYHLYGFKAVKSAHKDGRPTVWFVTGTYSTNTDVKWVTQYQAYSSKSAVIPNGQITASDAKDINLGQTFQIENEKGVGKVITEGGEPPTAISIENATNTEFSCGISEVQDGKPKILCAFPLYGNGLDVIAPIEKVMLMLATNTINTGTVIEKAYAPGILVDLTAENKREVSFDINDGWSWGGGNWAEQIPARANIVTKLIEFSPSPSYHAFLP